MEALIVLAVVACIAAVVAGHALANARNKETRELQRRQERTEEGRLKACGEVVLFFANHLGYIAKQTINRQELEELIDSGLSAEQLGEEIVKRINQVEGQILGYQTFGRRGVPVKLTDSFRHRHVYAIGKSGTGKTNLLRGMIMQDLAEGEGLGVIAPEAELLTEELLPFIPEHRIDDVIYFDPADAESPVCFNPLHLDEGEDVDIKVDEVLTIFKRAVGDTGPRMEEILRQALYALIGRPEATLLDIERLVNRADDGFRKEVIRGCSDPAVVRFWTEVYPTFPKDAHLPITNRLGRFLRPKAVRNVLCQPLSSLSFSKAMDEGRILLFNLSDGILGEQNSQLLGQLVVSKFQLAVMARAKATKINRRQFYLYVDEFQSFVGLAGASYEKLLSRARKYRMGLVLAHQQTGQIPSDLLREILGNVSTAICFQVSREDAQRFSKEFVTEYDGEIINVPAEEILRLKVGEAFCKMGQHSFRMNTLLVDEKPNRQMARLAVETSRRNYGSKLLVDGTSSTTRTNSVADPDAALEGLDPSRVFEE